MVYSESLLTSHSALKKSALYKELTFKRDPIFFTFYNTRTDTSMTL